MNILLDLFLTFAKIGLFTFGGGYAMISMIENNCVERKQWITHDEMMNVTVIAESTPGPIAINCATFTGYKKAGFIGAFVATFGIVVPSFVVIYLISMFLDNFLELTIIANAFKGIKIAVGFLILDAAITMVKKMHKKILLNIVIFVNKKIPYFSLFYSWMFPSNKKVNCLIVRYWMGTTLWFVFDFGSYHRFLPRQILNCPVCKLGWVLYGSLEMCPPGDESGSDECCF